MLLVECFVPGSSFLGIALIGNAKALRLQVLGALEALGNRHNRRPLRGLYCVASLVACLRVVARCFKGCFMGGSIRVIEDILLSERDGNVRPSSNGRASHT